MRLNQSLPACLALLVALALTPSAWAQGTAVLTGKVIDAATREPLGDAVVTASSPALQGEQVVATDGTGLYRIPNLPAGVYRIRLEKEAYKPFSRGDINVRADRTIRVNVELLPEAIRAEEVVVVGRAPTVDVGSTATGLNVGSDVIRSFPLVRPGSRNSAARSFEAVGELAPGASFDDYGVSISGTTSPENHYVIDGLTVNDPAFGILGAPLTLEFVEEVNVITGGFMPEYGRATGGIMNVVTKRGSNEFRGSVFGHLTPGLLQGSSTPSRYEGSTIQTSTRLWNLGDFGAELGGPILKDKLWFHVGFAPSYTRYRLTRRAEVQGVTVPGSEAGYFADQQSIQYLGKLTYLLTPDHHLTFSVYGTPTRSGGSGKLGIEPQSGEVEASKLIGPLSALAHRYGSSSNAVALKWSSAFLDKHLLFDAVLGWHHQDASVLPMDGSLLGSADGLAGDAQVIFRRSPAHSILDFEPALNAPECASPGACPQELYVLGGPGYLEQSSLDRYQVRAMGTYLLTALGHHVIKGGVDFELTRFDRQKAYSGGAILEESPDGDYFAHVRELGYLEGPDQPVTLASKRGQSSSTTVGAFLQNSWSVFDLFTLNLGVRHDRQTIYGTDGRVAVALNDQFSPRLGLVYDFTQQGRSKLYANFARFYEAVPLDIGDRVFGQETTLYRARDVAGCDPLADYGQTKNECQDPSNLIPLAGPSSPSTYTIQSGGAGSEQVDPALRPQASEEIVLGGELEVIPDGRAGLSYTRRYMLDVVEDMSRDEAYTYFVGNPGVGIAADFPPAVRDYDAVTLYFSKSFSDRWLAQASYTYSRLWGNYAGLYRPETGQLDPNINTDFDLISLLDNRLGPLPGDRTHQLKLFGAREFVLTGSMSLTLGVMYRARSGAPLNYFGAHAIYGLDEVFVLPRGSGGRLPWVHDVDGQLGFTYRLNRDNALTVTLDVFNVFNFQAPTAVDERFTSADIQPYRYDPASGVTPQEAICIAGDEPCDSPLLDGSGDPFDPQAINSNFKRVTAYQPPRAVRLGLRITF